MPPAPPAFAVAPTPLTPIDPPLADRSSPDGKEIVVESPVPPLQPSVNEALPPYPIFTVRLVLAVTANAVREIAAPPPPPEPPCAPPAPPPPTAKRSIDVTPAGTAHVQPPTVEIFMTR